MASPKPEIAGKIVNRNEMAGILGCSSMTMARYIASGCPVVDAGGPGRAAKLNDVDVRRWFEERKRSKSQPSDDGKRRFSMAAAELKEIQLAEKRGELVPIDAVEAKWTDMCVSMRAQLLAIPGRLASQLAMTSDAAEIERLVDDEVRSALTELSTG